MTFKQVKENYDRGLWSKQMVRLAVGRVITKEQYEEITRESY